MEPIVQKRIRMELIVQKRREGKTSTLLRKASTDDYQMVCRSEECVHAILQMAKRDGLSIRRPITFDNLYDGVKLRGARRKGLIIDDLDELVLYLLQRVTHGNNIIAASVTGDPELFNPMDIFNQLR